MLLKMTVQSFSVGIMCRPYVPAGRVLPPTVKADEDVSVVFMFAPARQTSP